jgi:hypothetical protein
LALDKDAPSHRAAQHSGAIVAILILADCTTNTSGYDFRKGQLGHGLFKRPFTRWQQWRRN